MPPLALGGAGLPWFLPSSSLGRPLQPVSPMAAHRAGGSNWITPAHRRLLAGPFAVTPAEPKIGKNYVIFTPGGVQMAQKYLFFTPGAPPPPLWPGASYSRGRGQVPQLNPAYSRPLGPGPLCWPVAARLGAPPQSPAPETSARRHPHNTRGSPGLKGLDFPSVAFPDCSALPGRRGLSRNCLETPVLARSCPEAHKENMCSNKAWRLRLACWV